LELKQTTISKKAFYEIRENEYKIFKEIGYEVVNGYFEYFRYKTLVYALLEEGFIKKKFENNQAIWGNLYLKFHTIGVPYGQFYDSNLIVVVNNKFISKKHLK
jgi:hypothetical protein